MSFDNFYTFITTQMSEYFSQTTSILIIDDFSSILRGEDNVVEHSHFVCDKLCAFCAIFFSFRFTIGLNTFIVSRLEFFWYNLRRAPAERVVYLSRTLRSATDKSNITKRLDLRIKSFHLSFQLFLNLFLRRKPFFPIIRF